MVEDLKKTLAMVPDCPYAAFSLATTYHRLAGMSQSMQVLTQSTAHFEEASKKFPQFVDGLVLYAMVRRRGVEGRDGEEVMRQGRRVWRRESGVMGRW